MSNSNDSRFHQEFLKFSGLLTTFLYILSNSDIGDFVSRDTNSIEIRQFKAKIRASKPHFMQKVIVTRKTIKDAFNSRFRSFLTIFIPKLTPQYQKPHIMLHVSNGGGSCMFRCKHPDELVAILKDLIALVKSDRWTDAWWRLEDISEQILDNQLMLDEEFVDIDEWHKHLEDTLEWELTEVKKD